jgi:ABC-type long-subunit fatty acid transport system fused permease/ATPase subunit
VREADVSLINLVVTLIIVGVLLWLVNSFIPMDRKIRSILNVVVVIAVILWILEGTGLVTGLDSIRIGG